jgi:hypothetical protein
MKLDKIRLDGIGEGQQKVPMKWGSIVPDSTRQTAASGFQEQTASYAGAKYHSESD